MTNLELDIKQSHADGTETNTFRYKVGMEETVPTTIVGVVGGVMGLLGASLLGTDVVTGLLVATGITTGTTVGFHKAFMYSSIRNSLLQISNGKVEKPKLSQTGRTWKEKRVLLLENAMTDDRKGKVTRELVTNRHGIWVEEKITPIATTAVQVKSWDTVLDSIIKVHGLESLDKIASNTIPALSSDGKKLSWRRTAGNLLGEIGILEECTNRNCSTECRHLF